MICLPEEILQRILFHCAAPLISPRPSWHTYQRPSSIFPNKKIRSRAAVLLVCKSWLRITTPLFYRSLLILNETQVALLIRTFHANPSLGLCVRNLTVMGLWAGLRDIIGLCPAVEYLDLTLDTSIYANMENDMRLFFSDLRQLDLKHFVLRKLPNAYLTKAKPRFAMTQLSMVVPKWRNLVSSGSKFTCLNERSPRAPICRTPFT